MYLTPLSATIGIELLMEFNSSNSSNIILDSESQLNSGDLTLHLSLIKIIYN